MTLYYVDVNGGSDSNDGLTPGNAFATITKSEDVPIAANDTVHIAQGTYREEVTLAVSGTSGNPITWIGDVSGAKSNMKYCCVNNNRCESDY